jgi:hypothetical protein
MYPIAAIVAITAFTCRNISLKRAAIKKPPINDEGGVNVFTTE